MKYLIIFMLLIGLSCASSSNGVRYLTGYELLRMKYPGYKIFKIPDRAATPYTGYILFLDTEIRYLYLDEEIFPQIYQDSLLTERK